MLNKETAAHLCCRFLFGVRRDDRRRSSGWRDDTADEGARLHMASRRLRGGKDGADVDLSRVIWEPSFRAAGLPCGIPLEISLILWS
jgi:hypothetical protein